MDNFYESSQILHKAFGNVQNDTKLSCKELLGLPINASNLSYLFVLIKIYIFWDMSQSNSIL